MQDVLKLVDLKYNGTITISNPVTGGHRSFKIATVKNKQSGLYGKRIVYLLTGPDNTMDWTGWGFVDGDHIAIWSKFKTDTFRKYANMLTHPWQWTGKVKYQHAIRCRVCNRPLTDPTSIELGIGPVCRGE